jgi:localization factor PodJL
MKMAVPWNVRGVRAEARDTARAAARRAGMSVGDWLNTVIIESAADDGVLPGDMDGASDDLDLAAINDRLDRLTRQLERIVTLNAEPGTGTASPADRAPSIDDAVAEISARQRSLDADFAPPPAAPPQPMEAIPPAATPAADLSGLETLLRQITSQIESLSRPTGLEDSVAALRKDLAEIGQTLTAALPRRAVEALEGEFRAVAQKIDQTRQCGVDPATVTSMERTLADMREALRTLTPAEKLVGFGDAINRLSSRIDEMLAKQDPAVLQQLEATISALRNIVTNVASGEALGRLADDVRNLSAKIDRVGISGNTGAGAEAISALDRRIGALADQITTSAAGTLPPRFEALLKDFTERFEQAQTPRGDTVAVTQLEERIVGLAQKLDASDARLNNLAAIERGLSELLLRLDEMRSERGVNLGRDVATPVAVPPVVDALKRDVDKTQNSLEDIHGTLGHVVDRLAMIETDIRRPATPTPAASGKSKASERQPINPNLPPDYPLEPGTSISSTPADRIAASEAALGPAKPLPPPAEAQTNFIAAARRAAQNATSGSAGTSKTTAIPEGEPGAKGNGSRVRSLIVGISVILIVVGGLRIVTNLLEQSGEPAAEAPVAAEPSPGGNGDTAPKKPGSQSSLAPVETRSAPPLPPPAATATAIRPEGDKLPLPATGVPNLIPAIPDASKLPQGLRAAADAGDPAAAYEIGLRYFEGRGVTTSAEQAVKWFERAAQAEIAPAQFRLGSMYEKGQGVKKDLDAARKLYLSASDKGNAKAMHNLAVLYAEGIDGKPDYKQAALWFRKGADRGISDSQYNLGILYARGVGVERNLTESFKWFSLAAASGDKDSARKRDDVGSRLEPQSLAAARQAIETWTAVPQPDEAINVKGPPGGWDQAQAGPSKKPRVAAPAKPAR